jgi:hypothetical protein
MGFKRILMDNALAESMNGKNGRLIKIDEGILYLQTRRFRVGRNLYQGIDKGIVAAAFGL